MKTTILMAAMSAAVMTLAGTASAAGSYSLDVTTSYGFSYAGPSATFLGGGGPSPDTGFVTFTNSGTTTFVGDFGFTALPGSGGDESFNATAITLAPGQSVYEAIGNESSNVGGFNGPTGATQPGVIFNVTGLFGATAVALTVTDSQIHSGVFATNPFGVFLDNYVIQGGDPLGRDTGDGFEVAQAFGHFNFSAGAVPEPASWAMMLIGVFAIGGAARATRRGKVLASA